MKILTKTISDQINDQKLLFDGSEFEFSFVIPELVSEYYSNIENEVKKGAIISSAVFDDLLNWNMLQFHFSKHYLNKVTNII